MATIKQLHAFLLRLETAADADRDLRREASDLRQRIHAALERDSKHRLHPRPKLSMRPSNQELASLEAYDRWLENYPAPNLPALQGNAAKFISSWAGAMPGRLQSRARALGGDA